MSGAWTDERIEQLKTMWAEGLSCSQIASRFGGGITRNAVIGKVSRMGLPGRATTSRMKSRSATRQRRATMGNVKPTSRTSGYKKPNPKLQELFKVLPLPSEPELEIPLAERKSVLTLTANCCRWPIGDPQKPDFHFCGKGKVSGLPYCEVHARRAFQPPNTHKRSGRAAERVSITGQGVAPQDSETVLETISEAAQ